MGKLTTHVLDTANGRPGHGIGISLSRIGDDAQLLVRTVTNTDGRTDEALLDEGTFQQGAYELVFSVGPYFADLARAASHESAHKWASGSAPESPAGHAAFLQDIPIRFTLAADQHYHVPLLVSPWSYSTYRGS